MNEEGAEGSLRRCALAMQFPERNDSQEPADPVRTELLAERVRKVETEQAVDEEKSLGRSASSSPLFRRIVKPLRLLRPGPVDKTSEIAGPFQPKPRARSPVHAQIGKEVLVGQRRQIHRGRYFDGTAGRFQAHRGNQGDIVGQSTVKL